MFEQTITNFNINFETPSGKNQFFNGDLIKGDFSFDLTKETCVTSITMKLQGGVNVIWSSGSGEDRVNHSATEEYFVSSSVIMEMSSGEILPPGTHKYPFSCQLPEGDFPSSFRGVCGEIKYTLTMGINKPNYGSKEFITEVNLVNHGVAPQPDLWAPISGTNTKELGCLWCISGPLTVTASLEKKAFYPGETVKVMCQFSNNSTRNTTPKVKLRQKQSFYHNQGGLVGLVSKTLVSLTGQPVGPHTSDVITDYMLTIPSLTPLTISNCNLLKVDYIIEASFSARFSRDLVVQCPIMLYDTSVQQTDSISDK